MVIVGGGLAGLTCAHELTRRGVRPILLEAGARLGGRVLSDATTFAPATCELGGEFIDSDHATMLRLARELGIGLLDLAPDKARFDDFLALIGGQVWSHRDLIGAFQPVARAIDADIAAMGGISAELLTARPPAAARLDRMSISDWLAQARIGEPMSALLALAYTEEYGLDADQSSALNLVLSLGPDNTRFDITGGDDERFKALGGNSRFVDALARGLREDQVRMGHRLEAATSLPDGRYRVDCATQNGGRTLVCDHLVLALPFTLLREVRLAVDLPPRQRAAIRALGYGANTKLSCRFASRFWREQGSSGDLFADAPFQSAWDASRLQPSAHGVLTSFSGGTAARAMAAGAAAAQARRFASDLGRLFPRAGEIQASDQVRIAWEAQPFALGSYAAYRPGQYAAMAGSEGQRSGNLHFCGEHTSTRYQGYMEGAAATGAEVGIAIAREAVRS